MSGEPVVDTNIWVYAHLETPRDPKGDLARTLVESDHRFVVSTQVSNEYYAAMLRNRIPDFAIQNNLEDMIQHCEVVLLSVPGIRQAHAIKNRYGFSLWDSLVVSSALDAGCPVLYSEDIQHDQQIEGAFDRAQPVSRDLVMDRATCLFDLG